MARAGEISVEAGVDDRILPAPAIHLQPRLERMTCGAGANPTTTAPEEVKEAPARAVVAYTRTLAKETLRAPTPWRIPCRRVVSGTRRARSAREMTAGPESARVAVTTARLTTGATIGPTARMSNTKTSSLPPNIFTRCGRVVRQLSCGLSPTPPQPRATAPTATLTRDYLGLRGQARPGRPPLPTKWAPFARLAL
jgi:hypothetical protein